MHSKWKIKEKEIENREGAREGKADRERKRERENGGASASIIRKERLWTFSDIEKEEEE